MLMIVPSEILEPRKGKRVRKAKSYGSDFQLYLVEGSRDQKLVEQILLLLLVLRRFMHGKVNTWGFYIDLPPVAKPLGCKWIFNRKIKVDGTIDKFKARLVIQGFRQKEEVDYFDTYAPIACVTTIRLLLALAAIHNLSRGNVPAWGIGAISWASKKKTCITGSTMESEFVVLVNQRFYTKIGGGGVSGEGEGMGGDGGETGGGDEGGLSDYVYWDGRRRLD
ncbi:zinc finger, CCHC-type containing protein [Tanacetum coccineum]